MVFDPEAAYVPDAALSRLPEDPTRGLTIEDLEVEGRLIPLAALALCFLLHLLFG